jgi:arsenite-transporting ATPase
MLERLGEAAYAVTDAAAVLYRGRTQEIRKEGRQVVLDIALPFVEKDQLQLSEKGDELTIQTGPYKTKVLLPRTLQGRPIVSARFAGEKLSIRFGERADDGEANKGERK